MTSEVRRAAEILKRGGLVAFPTETVYGLGADASSAEAVARLYRVKGRPVEHPVIVHFASAAEAFGWAREQAPSRLVYLLPGHAASTMQSEHYRRLIANACRWVADSGPVRR